ncbi:type III pantothenate kinase [Aliamphritea hakodatensis]|uniref:type III pantothenate kinase n=1 Tax=Aliamphritea hakodatensis TaxID=2895352 RepID=UPI0022FDA6A6|nr:type III pantothenate kinase [Aliamphritea hakodatensis]
MTVLDIDIGNSFLKWRLVSQTGQSQSGRCLVADYPQVFSGGLLAGVARVRVASVAGGAVNSALQTWVREQLGLEAEFAVTGASALGVTNSYKDPSRMGVDRWLAMVAAYKRQQGACWVVDCGSAVTVEKLSEAGVHLGGYIVPGLPLMARNLLSNTAEIIVDRSVDAFEYTPGTDTSSAVQQGLNWVFRSMAHQLAREVSVPVYVTGGDGELFARLMSEYHGECQYVPELVLDGLAEVLG